MQILLNHLICTTRYLHNKASIGFIPSLYNSVSVCSIIYSIIPLYCHQVTIGFLNLLLHLHTGINCFGWKEYISAISTCMQDQYPPTISSCPQYHQYFLLCSPILHCNLVIPGSMCLYLCLPLSNSFQSFFFNIFCSSISVYCQLCDQPPARSAGLPTSALFRM